ncbi:MAG: ComEC/Rec2 family competence protein [Candidatus Andersenbacteria bacterium]|nr:ComEC/Rec2 family competence protein [Candidatus Andersenbacteria bacterium]
MRRLLLGFIFCWLLGIVIGLLKPDIVLVAGAVAMVAMVMVHPRLQVAAACLALLLFGVLLGASSEALLAAQEKRCPKPEGKFSAVIVEGPAVKVSTADYVVRDGRGCNYLMKAPLDPLYTTGDELLVGGSWQSVQEIALKSPGYADYLKRQGIYASTSFATITVQKEAPAAGGSHKIIRQRMQAALSEPEASLALGMVFNEAGTIPAEVTQTFRVTGLSHVLAISGSNISLLAAILFASSFLMPVSGRARAGIISLLLWLYVGFISWPVSAVRAVFFWTIALFGFQVRALVGFGTISLLTATAMISFNPQLLFDVGFQLSLAAVVGIVVAMMLVTPLATSCFFGAIQALAVMLGATLFTWPISVYAFGTLSVIGLLANIVVLPLLSLLYILMLFVVVSSFVAQPVALMFAFGVHVLWRLIDVITRMFTSYSWGYWEGLHMPAWALLLWYAAFLAIATLILRKQKRSWREIWA